jgi:septal ring factor EnvC (AmiA/AmiB activator)
LAVAVKKLRSRRARLAVVAGIVVVIVVAGTASALGARSALEDTRDDLAAAQTERRTTNKELRKTNKDIEGTTFGRDLIRAQLEDTERQIRRARGDLGTTKRRSASKYARIPVLSECLNGVASALNAASVGDGRTALLAVLTIGDVCDRAQGRQP